MATTTNFGWETPDDTDLVKDGAAAIRTALGGVDTSFVDLKGGTTGQVLAKASSTDLDFTWATDASGIPATIFDAKGDIIAASAADTAARLAVGANDTVLTADSSTATGLKWAAPASGGMTVIASGSLSGTSTSISSIPSTYYNLQLVIRNAYADYNALGIRVNSNTSGIYSWTRIYEATVNSSNYQTGWTNIFDTSSSTPTMVINFSDYANSSQKLMNALAVNNANQFIQTVSGGVATTSAISSIQIYSSATMTAGTYVLYGVK